LSRVYCDRRWERGANVGVKLTPAGCLVLPAEGDVQGAADSSARQGQEEVPADLLMGPAQVPPLAGR
jgi:hypothetical protein